MPETTETVTFDRPAQDVFDRLADFSRLSEWDPMFDESVRLDDGPLGVGSRFRVRGSTMGSEIELELEVIEYEPPSRIFLRGTGEDMWTTEDLRVASTDGGGCEVTYHSSFETDRPDAVDAATKPVFFLIGKAAIRGMERWISD